MEESHDDSQSQSQSRHEYVPSTSSASNLQANDEQQQHQHHHHHHHHHQQQVSHVIYRANMSFQDVAHAAMRDDVWSCLFVLITFWFFASMTMILGIYGAAELQLGPNYSSLLHTNKFFVQSIKAEEINNQKSESLMLFGFKKPPPLEVKIAWTETHDTVVPVDLHQEWSFFFNKGSKVDISYNVKSPSYSPLSLVISRGIESLEEWIDHPSYPNTTLSWNIIYGSGKIQQEISKSSNYYIAVGNLNFEAVEVQLNFTMNAIAYNTTKAYYRCSLASSPCKLSLDLLGSNAAVLTSPTLTRGNSSAQWYVKLSYGPRWITYFAGSGVMTILLLLVFRFCNKCQATRGNETGLRAGDTGSERGPLLSHKDDDDDDDDDVDDTSSGDSWHDSVIHNNEGNRSNKGENDINSRGLCVICCDAPRDCFFLPCGHCTACFTCGTRIVEEASACPICRRKTKKLRKIFTV